MLTDRHLHGIPEDSRIKTDGRFLHAEDLTEKRLHQIHALNELAVNRGQTLAEMALSWVLRDGIVTSVLIARPNRRRFWIISRRWKTLLFPRKNK